MHFGENQLSRSLIGLSPLPTAHPLHFQLKWVRSSTASYRRFNLAMGRSRGFGSDTCDWGTRPRPVRTRFRCASAAWPLRLATYVNSQAHSAKGTPSPIPGKPGIGLRLLVGDAVSGTISLPSRGAFHLSLTVLLRYRWQGVFSLGRWSSRIPAGFLCPAVLGCRPSSPMPFAYGALTLCGAAFQRPRLDNGLVTRLPPAGGNGRSRNTHRATAAAYHARRVWALPRSLAATYGIVVTFFSSGYLDVSVHRLPS